MAIKKAENHPLTAIVLHWAHLLSMGLLLISGWYIHSPFFAGGMGIMRYIHFLAMYVVILVLLARIYWAFFGTPHDFRNFALLQKENKSKFIPTLLYYAFIRKEHPLTGKYNPMQKMTYLIWPILLILQALTGFALYSGSIFGISFLYAPDAMKWLIGLCGGLANVRIIHYLIMWIFILTVAVHVYLALAEDIKEFAPMFFGVGIKEKRG